MRARQLPYLATGLLFVFIAILSWLLVVPASLVGRDTWSVLVPLACLGLLWGFTFRRDDFSRRVPPGGYA
jgi:hypothetical protein